MFRKRNYIQLSLLSDGIPNRVTQIRSDGSEWGGGLGRSHSINREDPFDLKFHRIRREKSGSVSAMFLLPSTGNTISELIGEGGGPVMIAQASHGEGRVKGQIRRKCQNIGKEKKRRRVSGTGGAEWQRKNFAPMRRCDRAPRLLLLRNVNFCSSSLIALFHLHTFFFIYYYHHFVNSTLLLINLPFNLKW